jgi:hypothetical protein
MIMNRNNVEEPVVGFFELLSLHFSSGTEKEHKKKKDHRTVVILAEI